MPLGNGLTCNKVLFCLQLFSHDVRVAYERMRSALLFIHNISMYEFVITAQPIIKEPS